MTDRLDLRLTSELAALIARAADLVGETDRSWSRAAVLRATNRRQAIGDVPPSGPERLAITLDPRHRLAIDRAVERSGLSLSDWCRAVIARAAEEEISGFPAAPEKSTRPGKKDRKRA